MCESEGIRHIEIHRKITDLDDDERSERLPHREQLLHGDSDQVSLDSLLKAVIDISDCLNHQEEKLKKHESILSQDSPGKHKSRDRMFPVTAVRKYVNQGSPNNSSGDSDLDQSQTISELSSKLSSVSTRRSRYSTRTSPSPIKPCDSRKNISFSNTSVRQIDMENQRLLKEILNTKPKTLSQRKGKTSRPQSASAVNRQRQQNQIERENLRLLNRLQSVKATKTLSRDKLLSEHNTNLEHSTRISKGTKSRPTSARSVCSINSRASTSMNFEMDNESVLSSAPSVSSIRSLRSSVSRSSRASSCKGSRPASGKKKVTRVNVWEPGW